EAVRLQLELHRELIALGLRGALLRGVHPRGDAEQVLHVVAHLVREHVGFGELARRLELVGQLLEEAEVEVHLAVEGAVEGPDCGIGRAAGGRHLVAVQDQPWRGVGAALRLEHRAPCVLGFAQHRRDEAALLILRRAVLRGGRRSLARHRAHQPEQQARIDAEEVGAGEGEQGAADAQPQSGCAGTGTAAYVLDVGALPQVVPAHGALLRRGIAPTLYPGRAPRQAPRRAQRPGRPCRAACALSELYRVSVNASVSTNALGGEYCALQAASRCCCFICASVLPAFSACATAALVSLSILR